MNLDQAIRRATEIWVNSFNAIPTNFISSAFGNRLEAEFREIIPEMYDCIECGTVFTASEIHDMLSDDGIHIYCNNCKKETEFFDHESGYTDHLPSWGTMWTFDNSLDEMWAKENLETICKCGFRVYYHDDLGYVLGIDGGGYDFFEEHWIPLYKTRGLKIHEKFLNSSN